jgi:hypothetical protein
MSASRTSAPLDRVREALEARKEAASLRQVAREVGMSPTGLQKVLDGARPYSATRRKLERWYVRETAQYPGSFSAGSAFAALSVLVQDLPPGRRKDVLARLVSDLREGYAAAGPPIPSWVDELQPLVEGKED